MQPTEKVTLYELNQRIRDILNGAFLTPIWVIAEIGELKENRSGHCYIELVQKEEQQDFPKAKARATIWSYTYRMLKPYFETSTGRSLSAGIKVLIQVEIAFHEVFGISLNILDIEPTYTLGDLEQKRRETIEKLVAEGVFDMNKGLEISLIPKRVAVISSPNAAGLHDFINQIETNPYDYKICFELFEALMQGDEAENSIITALSRIYDTYKNFDLVVIIRGGGSQLDLSCFDSYWLSAHVAQFPLPIITGIGHQKDISVVDLVAHTRLKTPTAVAEFIIGKFIDAESQADELKNSFQQLVEDNLQDQNQRLERIILNLTPIVTSITQNKHIVIERLTNKVNHSCDRNILSNHLKINQLIQSTEYHSKNNINSLNDKLKSLEQALLSRTKSFIQKEDNRIGILELTNKSLDPVSIMARGYSITTMNGKKIFSASQVDKGDVIKTFLKDGVINSSII